jgi:hypothetical protein
VVRVVVAPLRAMVHESSRASRRSNRPDAPPGRAYDVMGLVQSGGSDARPPIDNQEEPVDLSDAPLLLIVGAKVPRGVATLCARQRGLAPLFARDLVEAVGLVRAVPIAASVVIPPSAMFDASRVASTLRMHAPGVPVALVLGPGRLDDQPRIMWPLTVPIFRAARDAITDIAAQTCLDWTAPSWDEEAAPTLDVTAGLSTEDVHEPELVPMPVARPRRSGDERERDRGT